MKIVCDYCNTEFDTEGKSCCPSCSASFANNQMYLKLKKAEEEKKWEYDRMGYTLSKLRFENKQLELEKQRSKNNFGSIIKRGCLIQASVAIIVIVLFVIFMIIINKNSSVLNHDKRIASDDTTSYVTEENEPPVSASFNEEAITEKYTVMCDKAQEVSRYPFNTTQGYKCVSFHIVVSNTTETKLRLDNSFVCSADGYQCEDIWTSGQKTLPSYVEPGMKIDGYVWFEIPEDSKSVELIYNGFVTLTINQSDILPMD